MQPQSHTSAEREEQHEATEPPQEEKEAPSCAGSPSSAGRSPTCSHARARPRAKAFEDKTYIHDAKQDRRLWLYLMTNPKKKRECHRCLESLGKCIVKYRMEGRRLKYYKEGTR